MSLKELAGAKIISIMAEPSLYPNENKTTIILQQRAGSSRFRSFRWVISGLVYELLEKMTWKRGTRRWQQLIGSSRPALQEKLFRDTRTASWWSSQKRRNYILLDGNRLLLQKLTRPLPGGDNVATHILQILLAGHVSWPAITIAIKSSWWAYCVIVLDRDNLLGGSTATDGWISGRVLDMNRPILYLCIAASRIFSMQWIAYRSISRWKPQHSNSIQTFFIFDSFELLRRWPTLLPAVHPSIGCWCRVKRSSCFQRVPTGCWPVASRS